MFVIYPSSMHSISYSSHNNLFISSIRHIVHNEQFHSFHFLSSIHCLKAFSSSHSFHSSDFILFCFHHYLPVYLFFLLILQAMIFSSFFDRCTLKKANNDNGTSKKKLVFLRRWTTTPTLSISAEHRRLLWLNGDLRSGENKFSACLAHIPSLCPHGDGCGARWNIKDWLLWLFILQQARETWEAVSGGREMKERERKEGRDRKILENEGRDGRLEKEWQWIKYAYSNGIIRIHKTKFQNIAQWKKSRLFIHFYLFLILLWILCD